MKKNMISDGTIKKRTSFEVFKSNVCHRVKDIGDIEFIIENLERDYIREYYDMKWYAESLYLLAMVDYLSRENEVPLCNRYDDIRNCKLKEVKFPTGILLSADILKDDEIIFQSIEEGLPEFKRFNIIEKEIRNVI